MMVDQRPLRKSLLGIGGTRCLRLYLLRAQGATLQHPGWLSNQVWLYAVPTKGRLHGRRRTETFLQSLTAVIGPSRRCWWHSGHENSRPGQPISADDPNRTFAARAVKPGSAPALPEVDHDAAIMRVDRTARRELEKTAPQINKRLGRIGRQPGLLMRQR